MLYSVIDIGSNTVKCAVYKVTDRTVKQVNFYTRQLGLISKIKDGILPNEAIDLLTETINDYISKDASTPLCFATESLRQTKNLDEIMSSINKSCGLCPELISGKDEALLSFEGFCRHAPHITEGIMADMGGGSTEILKFDNSLPSRFESLKFGCLSLRRDFVAGTFPTYSEKQKIAEYVKGKLDEYDWIGSSDHLCLVGGTGSAIGKLALELGFTTSPNFSKDAFSELFEYLSDINDDKIKLLEKHIPARVETIVPGICAYRTIIEKINADQVTVSHGGIRDGYLYRKLRG